jgi:hypothetical protein
MIQIHPFKKKENEGGEGRPQLGGLERFQFLMTLEKFQCLVAFGRKRKNILFISFHFPPNKFYLNIFFSIDIKVSFYHGFKPLLHAFHSFSLTYKLQPHILIYQIFHTFIVELILTKDFFFPFFEFMASHMTMSYRP